jgi:hypothetical protein
VRHAQRFWRFLAHLVGPMLGGVALCLRWVVLSPLVLLISPIVAVYIWITKAWEQSK